MAHIVNIVNNVNIVNIINIVSNCQHCLLLCMYWVKSWYLLQSFPKSGKICVMLWARATCPPMSAQFVPTPKQPTWEAARAEDCFCFCFYVPGSPLWTLWYPTWETARAEDKFLILTDLWVCEESSYKVIYVRNHVTLGNWPGSSWWSLQEYDICRPSNCPKCPRAHLGSSQRGGCLQI